MTPRDESESSPEPGPTDRKRAELERELLERRRDLQETVEELATTNEELAATNEELRSLNEELEVSQEELRSVNEELTGTNRQLERKVRELEEATDDFRNLLASAELATLFLDGRMNVRMFTPGVTKIFGLQEKDIGRPLSHFQSHVQDERLLDEAAAVFDSLIPRQAEVAAEGGRWYLRRILPYRTHDERIRGVVVTFHDITEHKRAEAVLADLNAELERRVESRTGHVKLLQDVATIANAAASAEQAFRQALARVCEFNGWIAGHAYFASDGGDLEASEIWHARASAEATVARIRETVGESTFASGEGLAGTAFARGEACWSGAEGVQDDCRVARLHAAGVEAAIAFPVFAGDEVVAILEFFSEHPLEPDDSLLGVMANVGTQLGRVVERERAERRVADVVDQEQQRLGEELHEGLGQQVTGLAGLAQSLHKKLSAADLPEAELSGQLVEHFRAARDQVKRLAKGLMPVRIHERGLESALQDLVDDVRLAHGIPCRLAMKPLAIADDRLATSFYRIAREAVNNALLHAGPRSIEVSLARVEGKVVLEVTDDGDGFPGDGDWREGLGLKVMRDRAALVRGDLRIDGNGGRGTRVRCEVPDGGVRDVR